MPDTRARARRRYLAAAGLILAAFVIDTAVWALACRRLADDSQKAAASAGWALSSGTATWGGWPTAATLTLPEVVLRAGPDIIPPLAWTASRVVLRLSAWHPTILTASAAGAQSIAIGSARPVPFTAQTLTAVIDLTERDPVRLAAAGVDAASPNGPVRIASATMSVLPDGVSLDLAGMELSGRDAQPITPPIDALHVDARITPPIEAQQAAVDSARLWRARDGRLELGPMSLRWGTLDATGQATLTLDQALQPIIAGQVTASGLVTVIEQLARTGAISRSSATAAEGMLAILSAPTGGGPVTLPVSLRDGIVSIARIPLLRLLPLQWD